MMLVQLQSRFFKGCSMKELKFKTCVLVYWMKLSSSSLLKEIKETTIKKKKIRLRNETMMQHWHLVKRVATITWEADRSSQEKRLECGATALRNVALFMLVCFVVVVVVVVLVYFTFLVHFAPENGEKKS